MSTTNMRHLIGLIFLAINYHPYPIQPAAAFAPPPLPPCPAIYDPVCGTDGKTYSNECILIYTSQNNIKNGLPPIYVLNRGQCVTNCICTADVNPVCGTDGITYNNVCYLECENVRRKQLQLPLIAIAYTGVCLPTPCNCPNDVLPVCGTDNKSYRNICFLRCASQQNINQGLPPIQLKSKGACTTPTCSCALVYDPVCASDGKTYGNKCILDCENKERQSLGLPLLTIIHTGECDGCVCPAVHFPVCASDGKTYENACTLDCQNKIRNKQGLPLLFILYKGKCTCICPKNYDPVCASDGVTYNNICLFDCENKRRADAGIPVLTLVKKGACNCNCSTLVEPICGSDNKTYKNICWLNCYNVQNIFKGLPPILPIKFGPC